MINNINNYINSNLDRIILFNPNIENNSNNKKNEEIEDKIKWEKENIIKTDIFTIFFDGNDNNLYIIN